MVFTLIFEVQAAGHSHLRRSWAWGSGFAMTEREAREVGEGADG
jgi:hypothetical protein